MKLKNQAILTGIAVIILISISIIISILSLLIDNYSTITVYFLMIISITLIDKYNKIRDKMLKNQE